MTMILAIIRKVLKNNFKVFQSVFQYTSQQCYFFSSFDTLFELGFLQCHYDIIFFIRSFTFQQMNDVPKPKDVIHSSNNIDSSSIIQIIGTPQTFDKRIINEFRNNIHDRQTQNTYKYRYVLVMLGNFCLCYAKCFIHSFSGYSNAMDQTGNI